MARKVEQDSFGKAVSGAVATSREIARQKQEDQVAKRALKKELQGAYRSVVHEFDSLATGMRKLKPIIGESFISPKAFGNLPPIVGDLLISGVRALKRQTLEIGIGTNRARGGKRGLDLSFRADDHELGHFTVELQSLNKSIDFDIGLMEPDAGAFVSKDAKAFTAHTKLGPVNPQGYANRILIAHELITFVKGEVEQDARAFINNNSKSEGG